MLEINKIKKNCKNSLGYAVSVGSEKQLVFQVEDPSCKKVEVRPMSDQWPSCRMAGRAGGIACPFSDDRILCSN